MSRLRFSAVVSQDDAKSALLMAATSPLLGGVLLRGDKGSGKTTLARGLAALLPGDAPFVELPLGATEERVIGSLDLAALLTDGDARFRPGLLAAANGGVLYVDEINLLADHLVDTLLDVSVSGVNRIERDGLSHTHPARFVLVASMNPEEGELRPQLLDRFGLSVDIAASGDVAHRTEVVRRQLSAEATMNRDAFADEDRDLRLKVRAAAGVEVELSDEVIEIASRLALEVGAEGMRADLMLCRAAMAHAALDGRSAVTIDDVHDIAHLVLGHRRRRRPFDEPGIAPEELEQAWQQALDDHTDSKDDPSTDSSEEQLDAPSAPSSLRLPDDRQASPTKAAAPGRDASGAGPRGRFLRDQPFDASSGSPINPRATAIALATRRRDDLDPTAPVEASDLRSAAHEQRTGTLLVFVVDASASMGVEHRMATTKAAVLGLLGDAYRRRGRVALVTFRGDGAEVVLRPTASIEIARARLTDVRSGGGTPLAAGLDSAVGVVKGTSGDAGLESTVIVVTDGRATSGGPDPVGEAWLAMERLAKTGARIVVLDTESGHTRLGMARDLANHVGATHLLLDARSADHMERLVRSV